MTVPVVGLMVSAVGDEGVSDGWLAGVSFYGSESVIKQFACVTGL